MLTLDIVILLSGLSLRTPRIPTGFPGGTHRLRGTPGTPIYAFNVRVWLVKLFVAAKGRKYAIYTTAMFAIIAGALYHRSR